MWAISPKASVWSSFSGSVKKHLSDLNEINSIKDQDILDHLKCLY